MVVAHRAAFDPPLIAYKDADETVNNSVTLQADDDLILSVEPSSKYHFIFCGFINSTAVADLKLQFTVPTGATMVAGTMDALASPKLTEATVAVIFADGTNQMFLVTGEVDSDTTRGNITVTWAQNTAEVSDTKMLQGSFIICWKVKG